jgi:putative aldouronate transport system permease protein
MRSARALPSERSLGNSLSSAAIYVLVAVFTLLCLTPFWLMVMGSLTKESSILRDGYQLIPKAWSLSAYDLVFSSQRILKSYLVTVEVTVLGTAVSMLLTCMLAYALAVPKLRYTKYLSMFVFFTMLFSGGMVPWYILVTHYLHLQNTLLALTLPYAVSPFWMFLMRNFFKGIPESVMESARIDGATDVLILFRIVLPLSLPSMATVGLFYGLMYWNDWYLALMFIEREGLFPLQFLLRSLVSNLMNVAASLNPRMSVAQEVPAYSVRMSTAIITIGPIVLLYPFVQKYFVKGLTVGAIKG